MVWLKAAGIGALVVLLFLVQRFFPRRGIFAIFCLVLLGAGVVLFMTREEKTTLMTAAERDHISEQQGMVVDCIRSTRG